MLANWPWCSSLMGAWPGRLASSSQTAASTTSGLYELSMGLGENDSVVASGVAVINLALVEVDADFDATSVRLDEVLDGL